MTREQLIDALAQAEYATWVGMPPWAEAPDYIKKNLAREVSVVATADRLERAGLVCIPATAFEALGQIAIAHDLDANGHTIRVCTICDGFAQYAENIIHKDDCPLTSCASVRGGGS